MSVVKPISLEREYEKNPDISPEDIRKLREWVQTQPHLPGQHISDLDLLLTFYCCEKSAEVAKQVLDLHFTLRTLFTSFFKDRCFDKKLELSLDTIVFAPLPTPTVEGYRAIYLRLLDPDPRNFNFAETLRTFMMVFDLWQYEEGTWPGFVIMIDMDTVALGHVAKLDIMSIRQALYFLQECMLVKLKAVHFLNAPYFMDKVMMLLKPFMKKALIDMIRIHQPSSQDIYQSVPKEAFQKEEGGKHIDRKTNRDAIYDRLKANAEYFRDENRKRVNEQLRPGKPTTVEQLFGIQGSFKKLDID